MVSHVTIGALVVQECLWRRAWRWRAPVLLASLREAATSDMPDGRRDDGDDDIPDCGNVSGSLAQSQQEGTDTPLQLLARSGTPPADDGMPPTSLLVFLACGTKRDAMKDVAVITDGRLLADDNPRTQRALREMLHGSRGASRIDLERLI